jgi:hypothetical protein
MCCLYSPEPVSDEENKSFISLTPFEIIKAIVARSTYSQVLTTQLSWISLLHE